MMEDNAHSEISDEFFIITIMMTIYSFSLAVDENL